MPPQPINQPFGQGLEQRLAGNLPFRRVYYKTLRPGSLAFGQYMFWKHDPNPLILVTGVYPDRVTGVNLHYLTFKYVKSLLSMYCGKSFGFGFIRHDPYIVNAFRTYKKAGLRNLQLLDCDAINLQFQERRKAYKYNPQEIKAIRDILQQQLQRMANPKADEMANRYSQMLGTQAGFQDLPSNMQQDGRRAYVQYLGQGGQRSATVPAQTTLPATRPA